MRRCRATCLERALIVQRWKFMQGDERAVVIGIARGGQFAGHAWIEGEEPEDYESFAPMMRLQPRGGLSEP